MTAYVGNTRFGGNVDAVSAVLVDQGKNVSAVTYFGRIWQDSAVGVAEFWLAVGLHLYGKAAFVHGAVVVRAEGDEVVEPGFAAVGPVLDVVGVGVLVSGAAGEAAALVAVVEGAAYGGWNGAALAADIQGVSITILQPMNRGAVAGQAAGRFRGNVSGVFQVRFRANAIVLQGVDIGVDVQGAAFAAVARSGMSSI